MDNNFYTCDTIFWQGKYWLVPEWLENIDTKKRQPKRIISLVDQEQMKPAHSHDFQVGEPIPKAVLDGKVPVELRAKYQLINLPDIWFDNPEPLN